MENGTCDDPVKHEIAFIRTGSYGLIQNIAVCTFTAQHGNSLEILQEAVTQWINNTDEGREAYEDSCEDFNIGDLAVAQSPGLLEKWSVLDLDVRTLDTGAGSQTHYDKHLYKD